jgi:hypothetical protein
MSQLLGGTMIRHPYRINQPAYDPIRHLLAAIVLEAVRDCTADRRVSPRDRESARAFLSGEEGMAWLRAFGIPVGKAQTFVQNGHQIVKEAAVDRQKIIAEWIAATEETLYTLQTWLGLLEDWQSRGQAEPDDFVEACWQLKEAGLGHWTDEGNHPGIKILARAVGFRVEDLPD